MKPDELDGRTIRKARRAADITQADLAKRAGLPSGQTQVSSIEVDDQHIRSWRVIETIRQILKIE